MKKSEAKENLDSKELYREATKLYSEKKYDGAIRLYKILHKNLVEKIGENDLQTLLIQHNIACALKNQGKLTEALPMFTVIYEQRKRQLGDDHKNTLTTKKYIQEIEDKLGSGRNKQTISYSENAISDNYVMTNDGISKDFENDTKYEAIQKCNFKVKYDLQDELGRGCLGTKVYRGTIKYENIQMEMKIAVKRILNECINMAKNEARLLINCQHENIVRYHFVEPGDYYWDIGLELAEMSLDDYITNDDKFESPTAVELLKQTCIGLKYLHSKDIIHRDIKPSNILISFDSFPNHRKAMLSDFGISRKISSEHKTSSIKGSDGFIAPEVRRTKYDKTYAPSKPHDIHPLGCVFYYVFSNGQNPFGDDIQCTYKIDRGQYNIYAVNSEESLIYYNSIQTMINVDGSKRPVIDAVIKHPMFWNSDKSIKFFNIASNLIQMEKTNNNSPIIGNIETEAYYVIGDDWSNRIGVELQSDLQKYDATLVRELIRAIRNKCEHYNQLPQNVKTSIGKTPTEIYEYFMKLFPRLLIHTYIALQCYKNKPELKLFYHSDDITFDSLPPPNDTLDPLDIADLNI